MTLRVYFVRRSLVLISFRCKILHLSQQISETVSFLYSFHNLIIVYFGRGTDNSVDGILMIVDPSFESLRLSAKIADLSTSIGKPIWFCLNKVTEEAAQMMEEEVGKHGAIIGRMPLDHDLGLAGLTGTELQMTIAPVSEMAQFLIQ